MNRTRSAGPSDRAEPPDRPADAPGEEHSDPSIPRGVPGNWTPASESQSIGETKIRGHCTFSWIEPMGGPRVYEIRTDHCSECTAELAKIGCVFEYAALIPH